MLPAWSDWAESHPTTVSNSTLIESLRASCEFISALNSSVGTLGSLELATIGGDHVCRPGEIGERNAGETPVMMDSPGHNPAKNLELCEEKVFTEVMSKLAGSSRKNGKGPPEKF